MKLALGSNQSNVSNNIGGCDSISNPNLKRKRSTIRKGSDSTPSSYSGMENSAKGVVLSDITNISPSVNTCLPKHQSTFASGSCVSKISAKGVNI